MDESVGLAELMEKLPQMERADFERLVQLAVQNNAVDALSLLFTSELDGTPFAQQAWLAENVAALLDIAEEHEAVECSLMILNELEVKRLHRVATQISSLTNAEGGGTDAMEERKANALLPPICVEDVTPFKLLTRAKRVLEKAELDPVTQMHRPEDGGRLRLARVLILQTVRLQAVKLNERKKTHEFQAKDPSTSETVEVAWPSTPCDFSKEMCEAKGCKVGGFDLSEGAEAVPVQWVNEVDKKPPPPFVYARRCVAAGAHPKWREQKVGRAVPREPPLRRQPFLDLSSHTRAPCAGVRLPVRSQNANRLHQRHLSFSQAGWLQGAVQLGLSLPSVVRGARAGAWHQPAAPGVQAPPQGLVPADPEPHRERCLHHGVRGRTDRLGRSEVSKGVLSHHGQLPDAGGEGRGRSARCLLRSQHRRLCCLRLPDQVCEHDEDHVARASLGQDDVPCRVRRQAQHRSGRGADVPQIGRLACGCFPLQLPMRRSRMQRQGLNGRWPATTGAKRGERRGRRHMAPSRW